MSGATCSAHDIRLGVQGQYHFSPAESVDPWFGLGVGYEWLGTSQSGSDVVHSYYPVASSDANITFRGFEFLNLQAGADFKVASGLTVGPFLSFSLGRYSTFSSSLEGSGDVSNSALHEWLTFGVKGTFGL